MTKFIIAGVIALALTQPVRADDVLQDMRSAEYIVPGCYAIGTDRDPWRAGLCAGTIEGILAAFAHERLDWGSPSLFCPPRYRPPHLHTEVLEITLSYIDKHGKEYTPQAVRRIHEDFADLVIEALKAAWPCKQQGQQ